MADKRKLISAGLTALSCVGAITVAGTSAYGGLKAREILDERKPETKTEAVKETWKCFIPAGAALIFTLTCSVASGVHSVNGFKALGGAAALSGGAFAKYRDKVKELFGKETDRKIVEEVAKDTAKRARDEQVTFIANYTEHSLESGDQNKYEKEWIFIDEYSGRRFRSTLSRVLQAEYHINRNYLLAAYDTVTLNMFYDLLGIEPVDGGDDLNWDWLYESFDIPFIEFDNCFDKERGVYVISMLTEPEVYAEEP